MMELTNARQMKGEPVVEYINKWRALSLDCKDRLTETSAVEMCIQGMHWELLYILQGIKPRTFEELATRAHDMEVSIATSGGKGLIHMDQRRKKKEVRKIEKPIKGKEAMTIDTAPVKVGAKAKASTSTLPNPPRRQENHKSTLRELEQKKYPFPDADVPDILDQLLQAKLIELPEPKRPNEKHRVEDPKFCKYHRIVSHPTDKCFVLKELIMRLKSQNKIVLDADNMAEANQVAISTQPNDTAWLVQFGSLEPVNIPWQGSKAKPSQHIKKQWTSKVHRGQRKRPFPQNKQCPKAQIQGPKLPEG